MASIDDLKTFLNLKGSGKDDLLTLIEKQTEIRLKSKLHLKSSELVPNELDYIILEVCVRRFNRIKNEGMTSYSQDGESATFNDDDFAGFEKEIADYLDNQQDSSKSKVRFINPYAIR